MASPTRNDAQESAYQRRRAAVTESLTGAVNNLTPLQRRFLIEYLSQLRPNATQAYKDAGGTAKHADRAAHKIRHHPNVVEAIDEYFHAQEMSAAEVIALLSEQARAAYSDYLIYDPETKLTGVDMERLLADGKGHLVKSVSWVRTGSDSAEQVVEFHDAFRARVKIGEYHAAFKQVHGGDPDRPLEVVQVYVPENNRDNSD